MLFETQLMRLMFVINSLDYGGAERMLVKFLSTNAFADDEVFVVVLKSEGGLTARLRAAVRCYTSILPNL